MGRGASLRFPAKQEAASRPSCWVTELNSVARQFSPSIPNQTFWLAPLSRCSAVSLPTPPSARAGSLTAVSATSQSEPDSPSQREEFGYLPVQHRSPSNRSRSRSLASTLRRMNWDSRKLASAKFIALNPSLSSLIVAGRSHSG
jgi:hypothetical protein